MAGPIVSSLILLDSGTFFKIKFSVKVEYCLRIYGLLLYQGSQTQISLRQLLVLASHKRATSAFQHYKISMKM